MKKYMKKIMIFVLALALVIEPQMVKASKYVGKEVNINDYLKNTDDVLYSSYILTRIIQENYLMVTALIHI